MTTTQSRPAGGVDEGCRFCGIKPLDIVRLMNGDQMIVTQIKRNRPANPYCGVLVDGKGAEYKFGLRHQPVVVGAASADHPALVAWKQRKEKKEHKPTNDQAVTVINHLLDAVEAGDLPKAKILAAVIRTMTL